MISPSLRCSQSSLNPLNLIFGTSATIIVKELIIDVPTHEEQKEIGAYLKNIDHLITLHERKRDETIELKKYMLQKMFPQKGKKIPEIRFAGFSGDWEQRKLSEIADKRYVPMIFSLLFLSHCIKN